jgi:type I restriction enzyme S subunit
MHKGWRRVLLGDVLKLEIDQIKVDPLATYRLAGVYSFGRGLFERERLLGAKTSYKVLHRLRPGQLVMSKLKAWEGALAVVPETFDEFVLSPEFSTFTTSDDLDSHFLTLLCGQPSFWQILQGRSRGIGGRRERVHPTQLLGIPITVPPHNEQRRIVDLLSSLDEAAGRARQVALCYRDLARQLRARHFETVEGRTVTAEEFFKILSRSLVS